VSIGCHPQPWLLCGSGFACSWGRASLRAKVKPARLRAFKRFSDGVATRREDRRTLGSGRGALRQLLDRERCAS
jgi:hypothetical protein